MDSLPSNPTDVFACCLIGEGVLLRQCAERLRERGHLVAVVVSSEPSVVRWCEEWSVPRIPASPEQRDFLANIAFDYLFSIVNHAVVDAEILKLARRGAINYHDSPLPRYAGFNVTSWAILNGETSHGVTWHEMAERVDAGRILKQRIFDIAPDDTAFSLAARCHAAALETFGELLDELVDDRVAPKDQAADGRTYFSRHARPVGILDWTRPAEELMRLVRALDLGPENSPLGSPKFRVGERYYVIQEAEVTTTPSSSPPSSVVSVDAHACRVATGSVDLKLLRVAELDGASSAVDELVSANALRVGDRLAAPPTDAVTAFDAAASKHERFWIRRLVELAPASLPYVKAGALERDGVEELVTECPALPQGAEEGGDGAERVAVAFALFLGRLGLGDAFDIGVDVRTEEAELDTLFVRQLPLRVDWNADSSFETAASGVRANIEDLRRRQGFAADVWARQAALRDAERFGFRRGYPVVIGVGASKAPLLHGTDLELSIVGSRLHWRFDRATLNADAVRRIVEQFGVFVTEARRTPGASLHRLPVMSDSERRLVLDEWNQTARDVPNLCVHQFFEQKVRENPSAPAVVFRNQTLGYGELNARANELARRLMREGAGPDRLVGIYLDRSVEMLIAMLGVLKAGAAYVPLDPNYPADRLSWMVEDSRAALVVTDRRLQASLPSHGAKVMYVDDASSDVPLEDPRNGVRPEHLAYVIFTSGSTGRPKGVMIEHRNVANFFAGMDERVGVPSPDEPQPTWLAVTSISFDIHVLELLWTLARGFKIVLAEDQSAARVRSSPSRARPIDFSLFYFASDAGGSTTDRYRLLLEGAKFADDHDFAAVWTPERHFHAFGGLYPNPAVTSAALAAVTRRIQIRAGSVVLPLHHPVRVAEEWSVVDNLSGGRVGLSFASGWHANDFAFAPGNYADRKDIMFRGIETIRKLWLGESVDAESGDGKPIQIKIQPLPIRARPPIWITAAGSVETFRAAGERGFNLLTNLLGQSIREVSEKITAYREAWRKAGHSGDGTVTVMVHTFVTTDAGAARATVYEPFSSYLQSSFDLIKMAPWAFPAFKQPSKAASDDTALDPTSFSAEDLKALLDHAFDRYFESAGLFGTPESCAPMVDRLRDAGVNEIACLIDFGVDPEVVLSNLTHLSQLRERSNAAPSAISEEEYSMAAQIREHAVTHLQCTPSLARMMMADPATFDAMTSLRTLLLGGEALPAALAAELHRAFDGRLINMYGPTETTVWSTTFTVPKGKTEITIGRPIANTEIYLLDAKMEPVPVGVPGELYIGGAGVARGYLFRDELTRERFVDHPSKAGARLYRTGDLAKYSTSGDLEFLGRNDHQIKIRGFRIELGEIEAVLGKHPSVKEAVVVARDQTGSTPELVAYWVPRETGPSALTDDWHAIWDETYRQGDTPRDAENLNLAGWRSTYTGEALPEAEMREWVEHTVARIQRRKPRRVLEIGCGTGLLLTRLALHCETYTGVDFSEKALEHVREEVKRLGLPNVTLVRAPAHELPDLGEFDTIVLNSIVQYFPNADYLRRVLDRVGTFLAPGGHVFVGDVRSLPLLPAFHTSVELLQSPETRTVKEVRERVLRREHQENELVLHPEFFREWAKQSGTLASATIELKRGLADNEMTRFRYDVVLSANAARDATSERVGAMSLDGARTHLGNATSTVCFADVPNARLTAALAAVEVLARAADSATVKDVRASLASVNPGERPEPFWSLAPSDRVRIDFAASGALDRFDVYVTPSGAAESRGDTVAPVTAASRVNAPELDIFANRPKPRQSGATTSAALKAHARELLPEYMVPSEFVALERLPLTPNGKLDRKALPAPRMERQTSARAYVAAENDVEQIILGVWQELLNLEQLGATENFFDLGANSLLMVQANAQLKLRLERGVSLLDMFRFSNARTLAAHLGRGRLGTDSPAPSQDRAQSRRDALSRQRAVRASRVR